MRYFVSACIASVVLAAGAFANPVFHANTLRVDYPDGSQIDWYLNEDGSFTTSVGLAGTYVEGEGKICITPADGEEVCSTYADETRSTGDVFTATGDDGTQFTVTIVEGRPAE